MVEVLSNRSARIALPEYADGEIGTIDTSLVLQVGAKLMIGPDDRRRAISTGQERCGVAG